MPAYFDTSAFLKLVVAESGSNLAARLWSETDLRVTSRFTYPEARSGLASAVRRGRIPGSQSLRSRRSLEGRWQQLHIIEVGDVVSALAGDLAERHALTGADAIHLASALLVADESLVFATWDRQLAQAAAAAGLAVSPGES